MPRRNSKLRSENCVLRHCGTKTTPVHSVSPLRPTDLRKQSTLLCTRDLAMMIRNLENSTMRNLALHFPRSRTPATQSLDGPQVGTLHYAIITLSMQTQMNSGTRFLLIQFSGVLVGMTKCTGGILHEQLNHSLGMPDCGRHASSHAFSDRAIWAHCGKSHMIV